MTVGYDFLNVELLGYTARITVSNPADQAQHWQNTKATTTGVNFSVSNVDGNVTYDKRGSTVCFYPSEAASIVPAGATISFTFDVTALAPAALGTITAATLDDPAC